MGFGSGKKEGKASISFHLEAPTTDNPKMVSPPSMAFGKMRSFSRSPVVNLKDVASFVPFPSEAGDGYGLVLTLKPAAVTRLAAVTNTSAGLWLLTQVNGRIVDGVLIDKEISDGRLVIWKGVTLADIAVLDAELPRTGENGKKK